VTLLNELINTATSESVPVAELLRKAKVVAMRIDPKLLPDWVENELSGYPKTTQLPSYRGPFEVSIFARYHVIGVGDSDDFLPLTRQFFPEHSSVDRLFEVRFYDSISQIDEWRRLASNKGLQAWLPEDVIGAINDSIEVGLVAIKSKYRLIEAYREVNPNVWVEIVNSVRNRVLDLAITLEKVTDG
jgi:AbiTii